MIVYARYERDEILSLLADSTVRRMELAGYSIKKGSARYQLFLKSCTCVTCGLVGTYFLLETSSEDQTPHLNLYGTNAQGKAVLFTKDHIIPKSKGGPSTMENYQTMCERCNGKKGNAYTPEEVNTHGAIEGTLAEAC